MTKMIFLFCLMWLSPSRELDGRAPNHTGDTQGKPAFEVVSVREHPGKRGLYPLISEKWTADGYEAEGISLALLISKAYGVRPDAVIGGPSWVQDKTFDLHAKVAEADISSLASLTSRQKNALLLQVLANRFQVKAHPESKIAPIYQLIVVRQSEGLKRSADTPADQATKRKIGVANARIAANDVPIAQLASILWGIVGRPVVDGTGLDGAFSFDLRWTPDDKLAAGDPQQTNPGIFTALREQLGLELRPSKGPVDTLVVDSAELPTAN